MSVTMCACRGTVAVLHRDLDRSAARLCDTGHTAASVPCWQLLGGLAFSSPGCYTSTPVQVSICGLSPSASTRCVSSCRTLLHPQPAEVTHDFHHCKTQQEVMYLSCYIVLYITMLLQQVN